MRNHLLNISAATLVVLLSCAAQARVCFLPDAEQCGQASPQITPPDEDCTLGYGYQDETICKEQLQNGEECNPDSDNCWYLDCVYKDLAECEAAEGEYECVFSERGCPVPDATPTDEKCRKQGFTDTEDKSLKAACWECERCVINREGQNFWQCVADCESSGYGETEDLSLTDNTLTCEACPCDETKFRCERDPEKVCKVKGYTETTKKDSNCWLCEPCAEDTDTKLYKCTVSVKDGWQVNGSSCTCATGYTLKDGKCENNDTCAEYTESAKKDSNCWKCKACPDNKSKFKCTEKSSGDYKVDNGKCVLKTCSEMGYVKGGCCSKCLKTYAATGSDGSCYYCIPMDCNDYGLEFSDAYIYLHASRANEGTCGMNDKLETKSLVYVNGEVFKDWSGHECYSCEDTRETIDLYATVFPYNYHKNTDAYISFKAYSRDNVSHNIQIKVDGACYYTYTYRKTDTVYKSFILNNGDTDKQIAYTDENGDWCNYTGLTVIIDGYTVNKEPFTSESFTLSYRYGSYYEDEMSDHYKDYYESSYTSTNYGDVLTYRLKYSWSNFFLNDEKYILVNGWHPYTSSNDKYDSRTCTKADGWTTEECPDGEYTVDAFWYYDIDDYENNPKGWCNKCVSGDKCRYKTEDTNASKEDATYRLTKDWIANCLSKGNDYHISNIGYNGSNDGCFYCVKGNTGF